MTRLKFQDIFRSLSSVNETPICLMNVIWFQFIQPEKLMHLFFLALRIISTGPPMVGFFNQLFFRNRDPAVTEASSPGACRTRRAGGSPSPPASVSPGVRGSEIEEFCWRVDKNGTWDEDSEGKTWIRISKILVNTWNERMWKILECTAEHSKIHRISR